MYSESVLLLQGKQLSVCTLACLGLTCETTLRQTSGAEAGATGTSRKTIGQ